MTEQVTRREFLTHIRDAVARRRRILFRAALALLAAWVIYGTLGWFSGMTLSDWQSIALVAGIAAGLVAACYALGAIGTAIHRRLSPGAKSVCAAGDAVVLALTYMGVGALVFYHYANGRYDKVAVVTTIVLILTAKWAYQRHRQMAGGRETA